MYLPSLRPANRVGWLAFLALSGVTQACLSAAGKQVLVTEDRELVRECTLLGRVKDVQASGGSFGFNAEQEIEDDLREDVADLGGNVLLLVSSARRGSRGEAFRCAEPQLARIRPQGPADEDDPMKPKEKEK